MKEKQIIDGEIVYETWSDYAEKLDKLYSKVRVLSMASINAEADDSFIFYIRDVLEEIDIALRKIAYDFNDLPTIPDVVQAHEKRFVCAIETKRDLVTLHTLLAMGDVDEAKEMSARKIDFFNKKYNEEAMPLEENVMVADPTKACASILATADSE